MAGTEVPALDIVRFARPLLLALALAALGLVLSEVPARAATIQVTTSLDENGLGGTGACSLREALEAARTDAAFGGCTPGNGTDQITFDAASTDGNPINLTVGTLVIASNLQIVGNGVAATIVDGGGTFRVFLVNPSVTAELRALIERFDQA